MIFEKIYQYSFLGLCGLWIPFPQLGSKLIALLGVVVVIGAFQKKLEFKFNGIFLGFSVLYALYALYIFNNTTAVNEGPYLEYKLSLVVFPLLLSFKPQQKIERSIVMTSVVSGAFLLGLLYIVRAVGKYFISHDAQVFHSSWFAYNHHPSYAAVFFSFAVFYLLHTFKERQGAQKWITVGLIAFFTLLHIPLESLAGILLLGIIFSYFLLRWAWHQFNKAIFMSLILLGLLCVKGLLTLQRSLEQNISDTLLVSKRYLTDPQKFVKECPQKMTGNQARLILWTISGEIIAAHPLGVGISGLDAEMSRKLHVLGFHEMAAKHWNPHNQFLQLTAEIGWLGLLLFISILIAIARLAWQRKDQLLGFLLLSLVLNALFESMLQRQSGIVFYLLFLSAFIAIITIPKTEEA